MGIPDITTYITPALTGVQTQALATVGAVFPVVFAITGAIVVWRVGLSIFRSIRV